MKLLVFSDSHGIIMHMESAVRAHRPDMVLHLGDCVEDFQALQALFPVLPMDHVPGNCDYGADGPATKLLTLSGTRIFMTHGHRYSVKSSYLRAIYAAREQQADLLLFGHTHYAKCFQEGPLWVLNPGAARNGSYGIITLNQDGMKCCLGHQDGMKCCLGHQDGKEHYDAANH